MISIQTLSEHENPKIYGEKKNTQLREIKDNYANA